MDGERDLACVSKDVNTIASKLQQACLEDDYELDKIAAEIQRAVEQENPRAEGEKDDPAPETPAKKLREGEK